MLLLMAILLTEAQIYAKCVFVSRWFFLFSRRLLIVSCSTCQGKYTKNKNICCRMKIMNGDFHCSLKCEYCVIFSCI